MNINVNIRDFFSIKIRFRLLIIFVIVYISQKLLNFAIKINFFKMIILYKFFNFAKFKYLKRRC